MRKNSALLICIIGIIQLSVFSVFAQDISFRGKLSTEAGVGLPYTDDNAGKFLLNRTVFESEIKHSSDMCSLFFDGSITYDGLQALSETNTLDYVSGNNSVSIKLKEAWFDYNVNSFSIRVGRQITAWGKADEIQVSDILCPKDCSTLIASDYSDSRLGIDAIRFSYSGESVVVDAFWIPFFTPSSLPLADGNPLKAIEFPTAYEDYTVNDISSSNISLPDMEIQSSEFALKLSTYLSFADFSLYGFYGWDDLPFMEYTTDGSTISIDGQYHRMAMFGADAAIPISAIVLRFEAAFFPQRYFSTKPELQLLSDERTTVRKNQLIALAGIDWTPALFTITAQYYADILFGDVGLLERDAFTHQITLSVERSFMNENLTISFSGALGLTDFDSAIEAEIAYNLTDQIHLSAIADFYTEGREDGDFGAYKDLSSVTLKGVYSF